MLRKPLLRWPVLLLSFSLVGIGVAAMQAYRAAVSQNEVRERVLRDYARLVAWNYERHLAETLRDAAREVLQPVNHYPGVHQSPNVPHADVLGDYLFWDSNCLCHRPRYGPVPDTMFSFQIGSDTVGVALNYFHETDTGFLTDPINSMAQMAPPPAAAFGDRFQWINDTVSALVRSGVRMETQFPYIVAYPDDRPRLVAYTTMPTLWGDTLMYAVMYSDRTLRELFAAVLEEEQLLPPTFHPSGSSNRDVIALEVRTADGRALYRSYDGEEPRWAEHKGTLGRDYASLHVRAYIRPAFAEALVIGGLPRSQLPFLLGLMALSVALAFVAFTQLARENQLARSRSDFVASVSHELRTPLAQVRLFVDTLRLGRAQTDEARQWSLDQIDRESRRLVHLVDNVLVFTRGPERLLEEPATPLDLPAEVRAIVAEYEPLAASRRATIGVDAVPDARVLASRSALRHVLLNLLDNAVKYGPVGQRVQVDVQCGQRTCSVSVTDEGPGVPAGERTRIFEAFQRGSDAGTRAAGGSGIGLYLVRALMEGQGGTVRVTAGPRGGARFTVEWPTA